MHTINSGGDYVMKNGVITKVGYSTDETTKNPELLNPQPIVELNPAPEAKPPVKPVVTAKTTEVTHAS